MGINFAGSNDQGVKIKTDMAIRMKTRMEKHLDRIPASADIRQAMLAVKREPSGSGVKFDAPQIEIDSPSAGGGKRKMLGHADEFWAKAMASLAAHSGLGLSTDLTVGKRAAAAILAQRESGTRGGESAYTASGGF
jgi:hypothetical protein